MNLIHRKGIHHNLFLADELHSKLSLRKGQKAKFLLKNGVELELAAKMINRISEVGPEAMVQIETRIIDKLKNPQSYLSSRVENIVVGDKFTIVQEDPDGFPIELTLEPLL